MSCATCYQARTLPRCLGVIDIGDITPSTDVVVRVKSSAGRIDYIEASSDNSGNLEVDMTGIELSEMVYELSVLKASDRSVMTITTADAETATCIEVAFEDGQADNVVIEARA